MSNKKEVKLETVEKMAANIVSDSGGKVQYDQARQIAINAANQVNRERKK